MSDFSGAQIAQAIQELAKQVGRIADHCEREAIARDARTALVQAQMEQAQATMTAAQPRGGH